MKRMQWFVLALAAIVMLVVAACSPAQQAAVEKAAPTVAAAVKAAAPTVVAEVKAAAPTVAAAVAPAKATDAPKAAAGSIAPQTIKIVSALPMTGSSLTQTSTVVNSIKMALDEVQSKACNGAVTIQFEALDDATAAAGKWTPEQATAIANKAAADKNILGYIGHFNSGAAKLAIPINSQAGLVMISPANTYPGLTKNVAGVEPGEPDKYYPTKVRNYSRVVPADDLQGPVGARWAKELGGKNVYILDDQETYGKGLADLFEAEAKKIGLNIVGHEGWDGKATDFRALANKVKGANPDTIYLGGITQNNGGQLLKDLRGVGLTADKVKIIGPDGLFETELINAAGKDAAEGFYVTFGGVPPNKLEGAGAKWYADYKAKYNAEPEAYAAYGYEAAKVLLDAINRACATGTLDRASVLKAVFATKDFNGLLGKFSIDANGDTTMTTMSGQQVKNGKFEFVSTLK